MTTRENDTKEILKEIAELYDYDLTISKDGKTGDCKKVFTIMSLAVKNGQEVTISVEGADEEAAAQKIKEFFEENM